MFGQMKESVVSVFNGRMKWCYWLFLLLVIGLVPVAINYFMMKPLCSDFVGKDTDWLSFWGVYIGSIISTSAAFVVLFIQRKDNQKENSRNRELQLKLLESDLEQRKLDEYRKSLGVFFASIDFGLLYEIYSELYFSRFSRENEKRSIALLHSVSDSYFVLEASSIAYLEGKANTLSEKCKKIYTMFSCLTMGLNEINHLMEFAESATKIKVVIEKKCDNNQFPIMGERFKILIKDKETISYSDLKTNMSEITCQLHDGESEKVRKIWLKARQLAIEFISNKSNEIKTDVTNDVGSLLKKQLLISASCLTWLVLYSSILSFGRIGITLCFM